MPVSVIPTPSTAGVNKDATVLGRLVSLDTALSLRLHTFFLSFVPHSLLITLEITGDGRFWLPISIAFLLYPTTTSPHLHIHPFIFALLFGFLLDLVVVGAIKYSVRRPRPLYNKDMHAVVSVDIWSFPSGHSSRVFFIACYFWLYDIGTMGLKLTDGLYGDGDSLIKMGVLVWAVVTSCSRVLLGRHFVVDVVAGAVLGVFQGGLYLITLMKVREKGNCWRFNSPVVLELRRLGNIGRTAATSHTKFPVSVQRLPITLNPQLVDNGY